MGPKLIGEAAKEAVKVANLLIVCGFAFDPLARGEAHELDVYDPTTGAVRSSSVDDIAAWFLDTDYSGPISVT